jgi:hypothetical protein
MAATQGAEQTRPPNMPVHAVYDLLSDLPRPVSERFELAARRITATWIETSEVTASADDVRLAGEFLRPYGVTIEPMPGGDVRLVSERGKDTVMSRAEAVLTALRSLVAREQRSLRAIVRAA